MVKQIERDREDVLSLSLSYVLFLDWLFIFDVLLSS